MQGLLQYYLAPRGFITLPIIRCGYRSTNDQAKSLPENVLIGYRTFSISNENGRYVSSQIGESIVW